MNKLSQQDFEFLYRLGTIDGHEPTQEELEKEWLRYSREKLLAKFIPGEIGWFVYQAKMLGQISLETARLDALKSKLHTA